MHPNPENPSGFFTCFGSEGESLVSFQNIGCLSTSVLIGFFQQDPSQLLANGKHSHGPRKKRINLLGKADIDLQYQKNRQNVTAHHLVDVVGNRPGMMLRNYRKKHIRTVFPWGFRKCF